MTDQPNIRSHRSRSRPGEAQLLGLIERCYDAALEPSGWQDFLVDIKAAVDASHTALMLFDNRKDHFDLDDYTAAVDSELAQLHLTGRQPGPVDRFIAHGYSEDAVYSYVAHYHSQDIWLPALPKLAVGEPISSARLVPDSELLASAFFNEWLLPQGTRHITGTKVADDGHQTVLVAAYGSTGRDDFDADTWGLFEQLRPHLRRAVAIANQLRRFERERAELRSSLDALVQPVFLIGEDGRVFFQNSAAQALVSESDGLILRRGRLAASVPPAAKRLADLVADALAWFHRPHSTAGGVVSVVRPSGRPNYALFVTPLGSVASDEFGQRRCVAVYAGDPDQVPASLAQRLNAVFGLSPAEARLAEGLAQGGKLSDLAEVFGISQNTARFQLKAIFQKTETSSQTELVRRVLLTLGGLPAAPDAGQIRKA